MKKIGYCILTAAAVLSCTREQPVVDPFVEAGLPELTLGSVAGILSELPLKESHLREVHDAVCGSSGNGYDEEYLMKDLFQNPGAGVGTKSGGTYEEPLRDLFEDYLSEMVATKAGGAAAAEQFIKALTESGMQIYWPYSSDWDGETFPVITFDPGYGAESNYGYEISFDKTGARVVDSVYVDEKLASSRPVWVINTNDDSAFTPLEMFVRTASEEPQIALTATNRKLIMKSVMMLRNYDSWFAGASEFFFKCGSVDGFTASTEAELKTYKPTITDYMFVIKRDRIYQEISYDAIILTDYTNQLDKLALLITEDDGGTRTSWKTECTVKYESKSYGFSLDLPFNIKDDIVWRGQVAASYFQEEDEVTGRFGDLRIKFALE